MEALEPKLDFPAPRAMNKCKSTFGSLLAFACCLGLAFASSGKSAKITVLISDNNSIYSLIRQGVREKIVSEVQEIILPEAKDSPSEAVREFCPDLVLAIGNAAVLWAQKEISGVPLIVTGIVYQLTPSSYANMRGVALDIPLVSYLKLIQKFFPNFKTVGMVYNPRISDVVQDLRRSAESMDLMLVAEPIEQEKDLSGALKSIKKKGANLFLVTYDPMIMNAESFRFLVDFSIREKIGLVVPSHALLKNGGLFSIEADYVQVGRQAGEMVYHLLDDLGKLDLGFPDKEEVGINLKMAGVLNIAIAGSLFKRADYIHQ